jgi:hypothetical protein
LYAQKQVLLDSSNIPKRAFNQDDLQELKSDKDFQYQRLQHGPPNLWGRFWKWIWWKISEIMSTRTGRGTVYTSIIIIAVTVLLYFVLQVLGMSRSNLLMRATTGNTSFSAAPEDIHNISFDQAIRDAVETANFRLAIRLLYLQSLKELSDKGHINWQFNKSNADFLIEVAGKPWQSLFKKLTYSFERSWYGEMNVGDEEFEILNAQFQQFNNQLR